MSKPTLKLARIYDDDQPTAGYRVLVDRIWPRGISKEDASLDDWPKKIAPSDDLRDRFHDEELTWPNFKKAYHAELRDSGATGELLGEIRNHDVVIFLFGSKNEEENNAVALKEWIEEQL